MTNLVREAIEVLREMPEDRQETVARAIINYATDVVLCDLETGEALATCADQIDYSKGLVFLEPDDPAAYPLDFITFGRSGTAHLFRIHNEKCVQLGPFAPALLTRHYALEQDGSPSSQ